MFHFTSTDIFNTTMAVGAAAGLMTGIVKAFQHIRVQTFLMVLKERWLRRATDVAQAFTVSRMVDNLQQAYSSQQTTVVAAKLTAESAMQAVASLKLEQGVDRERIDTLENRYRNMLFYYNLTLNYCAQLLDYIHTLRELFAKHRPEIQLPNVPEQPDKFGEARTKYLDLETRDVKELLGP